MPQLRRRPRLAHKALPRHLAVQVGAVDHFQRDRDAQIRVERLVGDAHRPAPELKQRAVGALRTS